MTFSYTPPWHLHGDEMKVRKLYALLCCFPEPLQRDLPNEGRAGPGGGDSIAG